MAPFANDAQAADRLSDGAAPKTFSDGEVQEIPSIKADTHHRRIGRALAHKIIQRIETPIGQEKETRSVSEEVVDDTGDGAARGTNRHLVGGAKRQQRFTHVLVILEARFSV